MALKKLVSFGFKHSASGAEPAAPIGYIDVRQWGLANPHSHHFLKNMTGKAKAVAEYIEDHKGFSAVWEMYLEVVLDRAQKGYETVYVGCVGGKHRSVYLVERLGKELGIEVEHRDIDK